MAHARGRIDELEARVTVACAVCHGTSTTPFHEESGFLMTRCIECGFLFVNPRPPPGHRVEHHHDYLPTGADGVAVWQHMTARVVERSVALVEAAVPPPARVCDVGCGFGFLLEALRQHGYEVLGLEVGTPGLEECRRRGIPVRDCLLEEAGLQPGSFDVLTGLYVVEHTYDPTAFLSACRDALRPGGLLVLRWPHSTPLVRLTRPFRDLKLYDLPSHLQDFAPDTLERLLRNTGFDRVRHRIGGYTTPASPLARVASRVTGVAAETLEWLSRGRLLLPGVSKTTLARAT